MTRAPFLTPALSLALDLVRGVAALIVLIGHAQSMDMYTGPYPLGPHIQHHAVTVFFVLSGLVIAHTVLERETTGREYWIARLSRIVPVAWFAILVSVVLYLLADAAGLDSGALPPGNILSWQTTLLPALFLSESAVGIGLVWNPPYWSLVCEVFFYVFFGAAFFLRGMSRIATLAVAAILAGWQVLALFPLWLLGVLLVAYPSRFVVGPRAGIAALGCAGAIMLTVNRHTAGLAFALSDASGLTLEELGMAKYLLGDAGMGLAVMLAFIGLRSWSDVLEPALIVVRRQISWFAGISFTLYLMHMPILFYIRAHGIGAGDSPLVFALLLGFVIAVCALLADMVEHRTPRLRKALQGWRGAGRYEPEAGRP